MKTIERAEQTVQEEPQQIDKTEQQILLFYLEEQMKLLLVRQILMGIKLLIVFKNRMVLN